MIQFSVGESGKYVVNSDRKSGKIRCIRCCFPPKFANPGALERLSDGGQTDRQTDTHTCKQVPSFIHPYMHTYIYPYMHACRKKERKKDRLAGRH